MSRSKKPRRATRTLERSTGTRNIPPRLLILCEGKTEKRLLDQLRGHWRISSADIKICGEVGVPDTIVRKADELRKARGAKKSRWPETWAVFDRDDHKRYYEAIQYAVSKGIRLAHSNPCLELWGILLYRDQTADLHRHTAQHELKELHPEYHHKRNPYLEINEVLLRLNAIPPRIKILDRRAHDAGDRHGCPTTRFSDLVDRLQGLEKK